MPERYRSLLKAVCAAMIVLVVLELVRVVTDLTPLARLRIPEVPSLPPEVTNSTAAVVVANGTNRPKASATNAVISAVTNATNATASQTNAEVANTTNRILESNVPPAVAIVTSNVSTNISTNTVNSSNSPAGINLAVASNSAAGPRASRGGARGGMDMAMMAGSRGAGPAVKLPPEIQWRVDKIVASEVLGTIPHPQPMALLGIAGDSSLIRTSSGQMGWLKEGGDLGGLKLLRIGTNRVLVEEQGEKKELTIYGGTGGESLMPKAETHDEKKL